MLLSIDSAAGASVALISSAAPGSSHSIDPASGIPEVLAEASTEASNAHAEWLAPAVVDLLRSAGIDPQHPHQLSGVIAGVGPGPFTGLRVGLALAHSLAAAWELPLYGVCSLDGLALRAVESGIGVGEFLVATDARRREVYWAKYENDDDGSRLIEGPFVAAAADLPNLPAVGSGVSLYPDQLQEPAELARASEWLPHARELGLLAAGALNAELSGVLCEPRPLYLRDSDARVPAQMKRVQERAAQNQVGRGMAREVAAQGSAAPGNTAQQSGRDESEA